MLAYYNVSPDELYHHGVKGMKWGVRRYQNYDGSYTQKGLQRFQKNLDSYEKAHENYKANKTQENKVAVKRTKKKLDRSYDQLKRDKMADKGKAAYQSGKTITDSTKRTKLTQFGISLGAAVVSEVLRQKGSAPTTVLTVPAVITLGASAVNWGLWTNQYVTNRNLRAYYSHSSDVKKSERG